MAETSTPIPDRYVAFGKAVARLCRDFGMQDFTGTVRPGWDDDEWRDPVTFNWKQGRHGEDSDQLHIASTLNVRTTIGPKEANHG